MAAASPSTRLIMVTHRVLLANTCPSCFSGARSRSQAFQAQEPIAPSPQRTTCAARNICNGTVPVKKAVAAMTPNINRPTTLLITAIRLRCRRRSTRRMAGSCSNCARKGALANMPIITLEAPRCRAKAVRMTPVVRAPPPLENAASRTSSRSPRAQSASLISGCGSSLAIGFPRDCEPYPSCNANGGREQGFRVRETASRSGTAGCVRVEVSRCPYR